MLSSWAWERLVPSPSDDMVAQGRLRMLGAAWLGRTKVKVEIHSENLKTH